MFGKIVNLFTDKTDEPKLLFKMGVKYQTGSGVTKSIYTAINYYTKAVDLGFVPAMNSLGLIYLNGEGIQKDTKKAFDLFKRAADMGNKKAQSMIGLMYYEGNGIEKDLDKATMWWAKVAKE